MGGGGGGGGCIRPFPLSPLSYRWLPAALCRPGESSFAFPSLEGPAVASGLGALVSGCTPANAIISICMRRPCCALYGRAPVDVPGLPLRVPPIAMVSIALSHCCSQQTASVMISVLMYWS